MIKRTVFTSVLLTFALFLLSFSVIVAQDAELPSWDELEEGWNTLAPGGDTTCAYGTEYTFHVRPAESEDLLIFFNGGGACWFDQICSPEGPTFQPFTNEVPGPTGIFDLENEANPFADYNMVFVSYCTGDVHIGNSEMTYEIPATDESEAQEFTVFHNGYINSMTVLDWVFENVDSPESIFVTGSSAGAIAAPFYAGVVAEEYPDSEVIQLGDGAGGYRTPATPLVNGVWNTLSILPEWPEYSEATLENLTFEAYYVATAARFPDMQMAQYNTANDETQYAFLELTGVSGVPLLELLEANYDDIRNGSETFKTYTAGGDLHTILRLPEFYEYEVDGVTVRDWVADLASGEPVEDVLCTDCETAPGGAE
jgi:hypothetical protein